MCWTRLAGNAGPKKSPKIRYLHGHHRTNLSGYIFAFKTYRQSENTCQTATPYPHVLTIWWTSAHQRLRSVGEFGHPSKFQWVSRFGFATAPTSLTGGQQNFARCLAVSWAGTLHFWGLFPPNRNLPGAKFTLRPSLAFSYIGNVTARQSSSGRQPNFVAWYKEWNYGTFDEGATYIRLDSHHAEHRPTF